MKQNSEKSFDMLFHGFLIKKSEEFEETYVVSVNDYLVTEPIYGRYKSKKRYDVSSEGIVFADNEKLFIVIASNVTTKECSISDKYKEDVMLIIKSWCGNDKVKWYKYEPDIKNHESGWAIFKNFNDMYNTLNSFMSKIAAVNTVNSLEIVPYEKEDHKHIVIKKTFDEEYFVLGRPYMLKLKNHPCVDKSLHIGHDDWVVGVITNIVDSSNLTFTIVEPSHINVPVNILHIVLSIDEVEEYDIEIMRAYDEIETRQMYESIINTYKSNEESVVGEYEVVDLTTHTEEHVPTEKPNNILLKEYPDIDPDKFVYSVNYYDNKNKFASHGYVGPVPEEGRKVPFAIRRDFVMNGNPYVFLSDFCNKFRFYSSYNEAITIEMDRKPGHEVVDSNGNIVNKCKMKVIPNKINASEIAFTNAIHPDEDPSIMTIESIIENNESVHIIFE